MTTKTTPSYASQKAFPIVSSISQLAREIIRKRPGIYKGNLQYWLLEKIPKSTKIDIELAFLQLLKEGYFFSYENTVYPPNNVDEKIKSLTCFVHRQNLSLTDYGILYELFKAEGFRKLSEFSREVLNQGWNEKERDVKFRIQKLFLKNVILEKDGILQVNCELIREDLE